MNVPVRFKDQLNVFDVQPYQPISETEIANLLHKQIPDNVNDVSEEEKAELIAFKFIENYRNDYTISYRHFLPLIAYEEEDGTKKELPSITQITTQTISYWTFRAENTFHPVLVARYAGLVHEFSHIVSKAKACYQLSKKYIQALLDTVNFKLYSVPVYAVGKTRRALELSLYLKDTELIDRVKNTIISLENYIAVDEKPGLWGFSYDLLVDRKNKLVSVEEEKLVIQAIENRLDAVVLNDSWAAECAAQRLAAYYFLQKKPLDVGRILKKLESSFDKATEDVASIQKAHYIEKLYLFNKQFQLNDEAARLLIKFREISAHTDKDLKTISASVNFSKEELDKYLNEMLKGEDYEHIFFRIVIANVSKITDLKSELEALSKENHISFLLTRQIVDKKGRPIAKVGPLKEDPDSHLILQLSNSIRIGTMFLHYTFDEGIRRGIISKIELIKFLNKSCIIEKERFAIIERGIEAYLTQDFITAIHLLIPQFEEAIRNLVEMNGGSVLVQKGDAYNLKTFDHLLSDQIVSDVFGADMSLYFRVLFTDRRGWNFRNNVAHGLIDVMHFNKQNTERLLHALLCLGMVRLKQIEE